jgi:outer membrane protein OmpA-like peptidoglycan-associated protein
MSSFTLISAASAGLLLAASAAAWAAPAPQYSPQEIEKTFAQQPASAPPTTGECEKKGMITGDDGVCEPVKNERGFSLPTRSSMTAGPKASAPGAAAPSRAAAVARPAQHRDLLITFKTGSFELTPQAQANATAFAQALGSPALASSKFEIAGYTDSVGSADRNMDLSKQRAEAVKSFLATRGVDQSRILARGYGASDFADPAHPTAAGNRRVEARRID